MNEAYCIPKNCVVNCMKDGGSSLLACMLNTTPAILFLSIMTLMADSDHNRILFASTGSTFVLLSFLFANAVWWLTAATRTRQELFHSLMASTTVAWIVSLAVLACLSVSPLYLGRDNGDGSNGIPEAVVMVVLFTFTFTPIILVLAAISSYLSSRLQPNQVSQKLRRCHGALSPNTGAIFCSNNSEMA